MIFLGLMAGLDSRLYFYSYIFVKNLLILIVLTSFGIKEIRFYIMDLKSIFRKKSKTIDHEKDIPVAASDNLVAEINNWYSDRYGSVLIQRNLLFILLLASILLVVLSVFKVSNVSALYTIRPFVIEVEEHSGITNIVNPLANKDLLSNDALTQYFLMKYVRARESYCDSDYKYNYLTVVRLLSTYGVFADFRRFVNYDPKSPILVYGKTTCTAVKLRSIQFFNEKIDPQGEAMKLTAVIRFTIYDANGGKAAKQYKIASLEYKYTQLEMSIEDRDVNPLGFQIVSYKVDPELLTNE